MQSRQNHVKDKAKPQPLLRKRRHHQWLGKHKKGAGELAPCTSFSS